MAFPSNNSRRLTTLLLAAGASSRMRGQDKLLQLIDGIPLLRVLVERVSDISDQVLVALPQDRPARAAALKGTSAQSIVVPEASEGMAHSLKGALSFVRPDASAVMIVPADMPELTATDFATLSEMHQTHPDLIIRGAAEDGRPGHPVIFPQPYFPALSDLSGDVGARSILQDNKSQIHLCPLPEEHALTDLDTPEEWATWYAAQFDRGL